MKALLRSWRLKFLFDFTFALTFWGTLAVADDTPRKAVSPELMVVPGMNNAVTSIEFSPDGTKILTAGEGFCLLWDVVTWRLIREFPGHVGFVIARWSPSGREVLTGDSNGSVALFDAATGELVYRSKAFENRLTSVCFNKSGQLLLAGGDSKAILCESATGAVKEEFRSDLRTTVDVAVFDYDESHVLTGGIDGAINIWDIASGQLSRKLSGPFTQLNGLWTSKRRALLYSRQMETARPGYFSLRLWDIGTAKQLGQWDDNVIAFSPDEDRVAAITANDGKVYLKNSSTHEVLKVLEGHVWSPQVATFSNDGRLLATGGEDAYNRSETDPTRRDTCVRIWDIASGRQLIKLQSDFLGIRRVESTDDETKLVLLDDDGRVHVWNLNSGAEYLCLTETFPSKIKDFAITPGRGTVATGSLSSATTFWDLDNGVVLFRLSDQPGGGTMLQFSVDGKYIHVLNRPVWTPDVSRQISDPFIRIWEPETQKLVSEVPAFPWVSALSPNGQYFLYSFPNAMRTELWQTAGRTNLGLLSRTGAVTNIAFHPRKTLVVLAQFTSPRQDIYDYTTKAKIGELSMPSGIGVTSLCFSKDGQFLFTGGTDNLIHMWDFDSRTEMGVFSGHRKAPLFITTSHSDRRLWSASMDATARLWEIGDRKELCRLLLYADDRSLAVAPSGQFDASDVGNLTGVNWVFPDDPFRTLSLEVFMRDYYEPQLLARLLAGKAPLEVRPLGDLNRVQPGVKIVSVEQGAEPDMADVTVQVSPAQGQFQREGKAVIMRTDVYDLRLFREGQLVGQEPELGGDAEAALKNGVALSAEELKEWRTARQVKAVVGRVKLDSAISKLQRTFTVRLPHGHAGKEIEFTAYAFNEDRVKSETATARYKVPLDAGPVKRRAYVVTMGVNAYENPGWDLRFAASDAKRILEALSSRLDKQGYEVVPVTLISDYRMTGGVREVTEDHATREAMHAVLDLLAGHALSEELKKNLPPGTDKIVKAKPDDFVVLTVSSHGYTSKEGMFYIVPSDSGKTDGHGLTEELRKKWISSDELSAWLRDVDAGDLVMIVDTCHSASTVEEPGFKPGPMGSRGLGQLAYDKGMRILAASQADDVALESEKLKLGLLTYALVHDGLEAKQAVKTGTNEITLDSWLEYGSRRVPLLYQEVLKGKVQTFAEGGKDIQIDVDLSGENSSLKKPSTFQQPSLFNFQKNKQDIQLQ